MCTKKITTFCLMLCGFFLTNVSLKIHAQEAVTTSDLTDLKGNISCSYGDASSLPNLFDNTTETSFRLEEFSGTLDIDYQAETPIVVTGFCIVNGGGNVTSDPKKWYFKYSDDGKTWITAKTLSYQAFDGRYQPIFSATGLMASSEAHKYFRISISSVNGGSSLEMSEIQFFGYSTDFSSEGAIDMSHAEISSSNTPSTDLACLVNNKINQSVTFSSVNGGYIQYSLPEAQKINGYRICTGAATTSAPQSWVLKGSNDGESWTVLDRKTNKNFFSSPYNMMEFSFVNDSSKSLDWNNIADNAQAALTARYWDNTKYYYLQNNDAPPHTGFNYWWMAHALDCLVDGYNRVPGRTKNTYSIKMNALYDGIPNNNTSGAGSWWNSFYDDMEWMGIAALRAYQATNAQKWLDVSTYLYGYIKDGWTDVNGGGVMWEKNHPNSKNACSNGPAMILAARLYKQLGDDSYLNFAEKIYDWMSVNLVDERGSVWDGYGNTQESMTFTYNLGTWLGGCLELYTITKDQKYLDSALKTAKFAIEDRTHFSGFGVLHGEGTGDGGLFKGILVRYLAQMVVQDVLDDETEDEFVSFFIENGLSLWNAATLKGDNLTFCNSWYYRPSSEITDCSVHLSAIMLYEAINELDRDGFIEKMNKRYEENRGKAYRYFRLEELGRYNNYNLELSKFQLLSKNAPTAVDKVYSNGISFNLLNGILVVQPLENKIYSLRIMDMSSNVVFSAKNLSGVFKKQLNLSGVYLVEALTHNERIVKKIIF